MHDTPDLNVKEFYNTPLYIIFFKNLNLRRI